MALADGRTGKRKIDTKTATKSASLPDAAAKLAGLVQLAQEGIDIVLTQDGLPVARLTSAESSDQPRIPGLNAGKASISDDFDAELPDEFWLGVGR
jgi:prevent-host-death family protein